MIIEEKKVVQNKRISFEGTPVKGLSASKANSD